MWQPTTLRNALRIPPRGAWGVAVSGGADSVALLHLLARYRCDLRLAVVHVDHELRGQESAEDARFVKTLARELRLPLVLFRRSEVESRLPQLGEVANPAERWRRLRLAAYAAACREHGLEGVLVAHHADDLAETVLLRLIRGNPRSGTLGLAPLRAEAEVAGVRLLRPLLGVRRARLRRWLSREGLAWREDPSNLRDASRRNRLRRLLTSRPAVVAALLDLSEAAAHAERVLESRLADWEPDAEPARPADGADAGRAPRWPIGGLASLPPPVRRRALRRVLIVAGVPEGEASPRHLDRAEALLDAAGPGSAQFPGPVRLRRRRGHLEPAGRP